MKQRKIYYVEFETDSTGYTAILLDNEKILKTLSIDEFIELANKDDITVSRTDLIALIEELTL